ncbi:hypothetical protein YC2023_001345 [Brassica napus]
MTMTTEEKPASDGRGGWGFFKIPFRNSSGRGNAASSAATSPFPSSSSSTSSHLHNHHHHHNNHHHHHQLGYNGPHGDGSGQNQHPTPSPSVSSVAKSFLPTKRRLKLDPSEKLYFPYEPGKQVRSAIKIKNTSKSHVAFKFQTTAPKSCFMRPPGAILAPGETIIATVFKFVEPPENNEKPMDQKSRVKFKIMSLKVKGPMDYVPELFDEQKDDVSKEQILRVIFLDPERPNPALEKLKRQLAEADAAVEERKKPPEETGPKMIGEGLVIDEWDRGIEPGIFKSKDAKKDLFLRVQLLNLSSSSSSLLSGSSSFLPLNSFTGVDDPSQLRTKIVRIVNFIIMSMSNSLKKLSSCVLIDLDGTLINTDGVVSDILRKYLSKYGKQWDGREALKIVGKTPLEAATTIVEDYGLPCGVDEFNSEFYPLFSAQMDKIKSLPGANRLIRHLNGHGVPMALASNSSRANIESKISYHQGWKECFSVIVGSDEVSKGKPSPDMPGVLAGKAAGATVIAVPSLPKQTHLYTSADEVINSLLDLKPEKWGLPPFQDWIENTLPIDPWRIGGPVIKGFGRGSKVLGIPTANLSTKDYAEELVEHPSGVYFGWAGLATRGVFKMVMSIGWNPYFNNTEKTIEPWLLHDFTEDFYGEELRLIIVGYIRPEANFPSLESLVAKIHEDREVAEKALDLPSYAKFKDDPYLTK